MQEAAKKLAENVWGLLLARFVTPALLAVALWLGSQYLAKLDEAFDAMAKRLDNLDETVSDAGRQLVIIDAGLDGMKAQNQQFAVYTERFLMLEQVVKGIQVMDTLRRQEVDKKLAELENQLDKIRFDLAAETVHTPYTPNVRQSSPQN